MAFPGREIPSGMTVGECQPYARHYLHSLGLTDSDLAARAWSSVPYMAWNGQQWQVFADEIGQPRDKVRSTTHGEQFGAWLQARCVCASPP